jgi:hypothetical protein
MYGLKLDYGESVTEKLAKVRADVVKYKSDILVFLVEATNAAYGDNPELTPCAATAQFWRSNPGKFIQLCETHSNGWVLLALGVPTDMIAHALQPRLLEELPFWQSGYCKRHLPAVLWDASPGEFALFYCPRCNSFTKVVP